jgi:hypothetical protein
MGRTFTVARPYHLIIALNMWVVSWESNPARVKASGRGAKFYPRGYCIRITVTPSNGLVGTRDFFSGTTLGSILTSVVKLCFFPALLHLPMIV